MRTPSQGSTAEHVKAPPRPQYTPQGSPFGRHKSTIQRRQTGEQACEDQAEQLCCTLPVLLQQTRTTYSYNGSNHCLATGMASSGRPLHDTLLFLGILSMLHLPSWEVARGQLSLTAARMPRPPLRNIIHEQVQSNRSPSGVTIDRGAKQT